MAVEVQLKELLDAGVHFGHQCRRWNPKMRPFIYGEKNGIHIINLQKTQKLFNEALAKVEEVVAKGGSVLFVATKKQAQDIIVEEASRSKMFYVQQRWLGGMLTNHTTVKMSISKLKRIERMKEDGTYERITKKEVALKERLRIKLERSLGGMKMMPGLPGILFVIDSKKEFTAIAEAKRLGIPVIAVTDTNSDPTDIDYIIPGNDDSLKAIKLYATRIADAALAGVQQRSANQQDGQEEGSVRVRRFKNEN